MTDRKKESREKGSLDLAPYKGRGQFTEEDMMILKKIKSIKHKQFKKKFKIF